MLSPCSKPNKKKLFIALYIYIHPFFLITNSNNNRNNNNNNNSIKINNPLLPFFMLYPVLHAQKHVNLFLRNFNFPCATVLTNWD